MPSLALGFLDLLDDGEEDGVLGVLTVVFRAPAVTVVTADVVTSLKIKQIILFNCYIALWHASTLAHWQQWCPHLTAGSSQWWWWSNSLTIWSSNSSSSMTSCVFWLLLNTNGRRRATQTKKYEYLFIHSIIFYLFINRKTDFVFTNNLEAHYVYAIELS